LGIQHSVKQLQKVSRSLNRRRQRGAPIASPIGQFLHNPPFQTVLRLLFLVVSVPLNDLTHSTIFLATHPSRGTALGC
jgi:hypothetical protein